MGRLDAETDVLVELDAFSNVRRGKPPAMESLSESTEASQRVIS